jgi:hypothetical protein
MHPHPGYLAAAAFSQVKATTSEQDLATGSHRERRRFPLCSQLGPLSLRWQLAAASVYSTRRVRAAWVLSGSGILGHVYLVE